MSERGSRADSESTTASRMYQLDLRRYELRRADGNRVKLERQPMELLIFLVERKGQLVTRDQVAAKLWPDGITVDTVPAINNAIRKIRTAFHDSAENPKHLETVVGKGYRFVGDLEVIKIGPAEAVAPPAPAVPAPPRRRRWLLLAASAVVLIAAGSLTRLLWRAPAAPIRSLAVLPLQNLSADPAQNYFAEGITDELTTNLAKIGSLRVISRTSTMQYAGNHKPMRQIAEELHVDAVLEGSVVRSGNKIRVTAQLIDGRRDSHLWAQSYERDLGDVLELQNSIALDIASHVNAVLSPQERGALTSHHSVAPEAYEAYLHGRSEAGKQTQEGLRNAVRDFRRATEADPLYGAGYAGLADAFSLMANYGVLPPRSAFPRAEAAARKAVELDPSSAEAHASLAFIRLHYNWDWSGAEAEYKRALQLSPGFALAHLRYAEFLSNAGRHSEAIHEIGRAHDSDPLSLTIDNNIGRIFYFARQYDDTIREMQSVLALHPERMWARVFLGLAYAQKHMFADAIAEFERASELTGGDPGVGYAYALAAAGKNDGARRILHDYVEVPSESGTLDFVWIAGVYTALGDKDRAFAWIDKAYENRDFFLTYVGVDPQLDPLHSDPRFARLLDRIGFPR
jgi:TolB-like protein/DNA-binding winged helix-turn-helix (wHTH) protein/Flp pilus assembly protein TadD